MAEDEETSATFSTEVGQRLRAVRRSRRMSLDDVERQSGGRWSASAIGAYERGFRNLSLPRLQELAAFYDVPMGVLLGESDLGTADRPLKVVLDLTAIANHRDAEPVLRYLRSIIVERGDYNGRVLSIRRDDLRAICAVLHADEQQTFDRLEQWGALVSGRPDDGDEAGEDEAELGPR